MKKQKIRCRHDYKNAIKVGNIDYQCPLCGEILDSNEWFLMNSFEFIDVDIKKEGGKVAKNARLELEQKTGKKIVSGDNFKTLFGQNKLRDK